MMLQHSPSSRAARGERPWCERRYDAIPVWLLIAAVVALGAAVIALILLGPRSTMTTYGAAGSL